MTTSCSLITLLKLSYLLLFLKKRDPLLNDKKDHTEKEMLPLRFLERKVGGLENDPFNSCC